MNTRTITAKICRRRILPNQNFSVNRSPQSHEAAPAADGKPHFLGRNGEMHQLCGHCLADIVNGHWFCRLPGSEATTLLCSPPCALRYFDRSHTERNGSAQDWDSYEHRFHFFINGEQPWS